MQRFVKVRIDRSAGPDLTDVAQTIDGSGSEVCLLQALPVNSDLAVERNVFRAHDTVVHAV